MQRSYFVGLSLLALCYFSPSAIAQPLTTTISAQPHQNFAAFVSQAQETATQLLQQHETSSITILGERNGSVTPLLIASKQQTKYFPSAAALLGFIKPPAPKPTKPSIDIGEEIDTNDLISDRQFETEEVEAIVPVGETDEDANMSQFSEEY